MQNTWKVNDLVGRLVADPWRESRPFSPDMAKCHQVLFDVHRTRRERIAAIVSWLAEFQPCLFGQMEAKRGRLAVCLLTKNDLERSDQEIREQIEQERVAWKRLGWDGQSHGFLIVAVSPLIATARPGPDLHNVARELYWLYLGETASDVILHDALLLKIARERTPLERRSWKVGVNYFSAQGDGRWWHDHRFPGGLAFSMNSVGHMARAMAEREMAGNPVRVSDLVNYPREKLVYWALPKAMKTIGPQTPGSGRGTWLAKHGSFDEDRVPPTFEERQRYFSGLAGFSENRYKGLYHTDHTIPSPYFDETLWRAEDIPERDDLYFTYLHNLADVDYRSMGLGLEVGPEEGNPGENEKGA